MFDQKVKFIMKTASVMHRYGASSDRIEAAMYLLAEKLKVKAEFFSLPTSFMATFSDENNDEFTRMLRLEPGKINLHKYYLADRTVDDVVDEKMTLNQGILFLEELIPAKNFHGDWAVNFSIMILATCVTFILGGGLYDAFLAGALGLLSGIVSAAVKLERLDTVKEGFLCFIIGFSALVGAHFISSINPNIVILSAIIYYIPGLNLTMAMGEIASQNLTAGTARLAGAILILLKIGFGTYLGSELAQKFFPVSATESVTYNPWLIFVGIIIASFSFVISFQARWKELPWMVLAGTSTFYIHMILKNQLENLPATLVAGIYLGAMANAYSRFLNRPAMIVSLPAIILLVPGSVGYKGFQFLFINETLIGINQLFNSFNIGIALVVGTYFGSILIKPRRII